MRMELERMPGLLVVCIMKLIQACKVTDCSSIGLDCQGIQDLGFTDSGVYHVTPTGFHDGFDAYCDMDTDGGGWLVFQRRVNGTTDFDLGWIDYENGFGDVYKEYWLGNIPLHILTSRSDYQLRIDLQDWDGNSKYAKYKTFKIGGAYERYRLDIGGYSGDAGDSLSYHNFRRFATKDNDKEACATKFQGGWWFLDCQTSNLNGIYKHDGGELAQKSYNKRQGIQWMTWKGIFYSLKSAEMKIKRL